MKERNYYMETMKFEELGIDERILRAVTEMGFEEASPIQTKSIPVLLEGKDVIGQAQTGTGKTAAFGIPLLMNIDPDDKHLQAIVLCPTRELAIQASEEFRNFAKYMHNVKILPVYGGQDISRQIRALKGGTQVIIGTPGRVMDHMRRKTIKFDHVHTVVLDEADEMLNMGFREDMETILEQVPEERQTALFSATMPRPILEITKKFQKNAKTIKVVKKELTTSNIEQFYYEVHPRKKIEVLNRLLTIYNPKLSLVFCNTKRQVDDLVTALQDAGFTAEGLHGDLKQSQRDRVMNSFRCGRTQILVATDVAARGIDVDDVEAVFNYDLPQDEEYYVHRIGRTGRAGRTGVALTFIWGRETYRLKDIQRYCKTKIKLRQIPSLKDVKRARTEKVFEQLRDILDMENLNSFKDSIEHFAAMEEIPSLDVAAALLAMNIGNEKAQKEEPVLQFGNTGAEPGMVRFFINLGKNQGVRTNNILGAVAGESGMPGKLVGSIDIFDRYSFVEVPEEHAATVMKSMSNAKIKGRKVNMEPANQK